MKILNHIRKIFHETKFMIGPRRFWWRRKKRVILWISELFLDSEDILEGTPKRNWFLRKLGLKIGENTRIDYGFQADWPNVTIGNNVLIRENCRIWGGTTIEDNMTLSAGVQLIMAGHNPTDCQ